MQKNQQRKLSLKKVSIAKMQNVLVQWADTGKPPSTVFTGTTDPTSNVFGCLANR